MDTRRAFILVLSLAAFLTSTHAEDTVSTLEDVSRIQDDSTPKNYRLPSTMHPTAYNITITPTLSGKFEFLGETIINVTVDKVTKSIVLHQGDITIETVSITVQGKPVLNEPLQYDKETEMCRIDLNETLNVGDNVVLNFKHKGHLRDDMIGFYKSSYINSNNSIKWLATTQFQTTHARHAFPCFDEPAFKAKFTIRIIRVENNYIISNMVLDTIETISSNPDVYLHIFEQSVPMSTYLVAFAILDFDSVEKGSMAVWARPNAREQTFYALNIGYEALWRLGAFFEQDYGMEKMDMVAVPDFSAGAMENWGMITYRESRLLYDEKESNVVAQQNVASVIVHEITHMWFGNLLTPSWWSYLWLSEGFARYFQYFGTAMLETTWNMEGQFLVEQHQAALAVDAIETSKPMTREVATPSDISTIGDSITYSKGACIVRMMSHIVGADKFQKALQIYIRDNKDKGVVEPTNLWAALQNVNPSKIIIEAVMNTWTKQSGFPVLSVKIEKGKIMLHQERFLLRNLKATPVNTTYHIPITYTTKNDIDFNSTEVKQWIIGESFSFDVDISDSDWIIFNVQQTGFYRVNYDHDLWYRIINTLNSPSFEKIHVYNRAGIIDDLLNLARAGLLDYAVAIDGLQYLQQEKNYLPFKAAFRAFDYLTQRFSGDEFNYILYKSYVLSLIKNVYNDLGYIDQPNDDRLTVQLRRELNDLACKFGHEKCLATSLKLFHRWSKDEVYRIEPNQRSTAYCTGILHGNLEEWNHLWNHYKTSNVASEQSVVLNALGCSTDINILEQYLHYAISPYEENRIRKQDSQTVFSSVYSSSLIGASFVLDFVDKNHVKMAEYYGGYGAIGSILSGASRYLSTQELIDKFEELIKKHSEFTEIRKSLDSSLELANYELAWYKKNADKIVSWMKNKLPGNEETTIYRLPENVIPQKYIISLEPFLEPGNFTFNGYVQIMATVVKSTSEIVLHVSDIVYHSVQVFVDETEINVKPSIIGKYDFLVIKLEKSVEANTKITIGIEFTGQLNTEMRGFYRSSYMDEDQNKRWLAATHLEPVGARKMFPCFDEPAMKAIFSLNVIIPEGYHAISNMKTAGIEKNPGTSKYWYRFEDTKIMSTYLVALVISDFEYQNETVASKEYSVWARPNTTDETSYALSLMEPLVNTYEKLFKYNYPLTKLDMVALPDFISGAMENWGLLTFKEPNLLWDPKESDTWSKQRVTNVISHEIAHQWFGDLVTPSWWKYIWLNEGFARYFQYFATSHIKDTWELESQFVVDQLHSAFASDALASSHPMTQDVYSPAEIRNMFDTISYAKAASVIRMIEKSLGTDIFYTALQQYLEARKYNVASPDDLYTALADQITDNKFKDKLDKILDSWTTQAGYPVVNVSLSKYSGSVIFTQQRFLLRDEKNESDDKIWHIPITWTTESNPIYDVTQPQLWLTYPTDSVYVNDVGKWIIVNVQQAGYYRVNYNEDTWKNIIQTLKSQKFENIHPINRAALIDDLMNLARAGYVDYQLVFEATEYLEREQHYIPWRAFFNGLEYLDRKFEGQPIYKYFTQHVRKIMTPIVRKLIGRNDTDEVNTPHTSSLLRMDLHWWSCKYNIEECFPNMNLLPPDQKSGVYCKMAKNKNIWIALFKMYKETKVTSKKRILLKALGCGLYADYLKRLLEIATTEDSVIRYQDSTGVFASVYESTASGPQLVMNFMKSNLQTMFDYYNDNSKIKTIMEGLAKRISTVEQHTQYKELSNMIESDVPTLKESLKACNDLILYEQNWYRKNIPIISYWLEKNYRVEDYRLPTELHPVYYNLNIGVEGDTTVFFGSAKIDIVVAEPTFRIVLNSRNLEIHRVDVYETPSDSSVKESKIFKTLGFHLIPESQNLVIYLDSYTSVSNISVEISYIGYINSQQQGLYRSEYRVSDQITSHYLATYFRPNYARMVFPCFDEPNFKAKFKLHIKRKYNVKTLSNMPLEKTVYNVAYNEDIYKETPIMSTYLLAFVVSNFTPIRNDKEKFNVWGMHHFVEHGSSVQYAAFKYYEALKSLVANNIDSVEKIDLLALPNFQTNGVENWGLFMFQDAALFYEDDYIPLSQKHSILINVANQIAHIYFGNLLTCEWWSYAWLNEGLPQYFQWLLYEKTMDEPYFSDYFVVHDMHDVMELDSTVFSHSLNYPVSSPDTLRKPFNKISSKKAASLMRMIHRTFGGMNFYFSLERYVRNNQYDTVTPKKLWTALQPNIHNVSIEKVMNTWIEEPGYPYIRVTLDNKTGILEISQIRMFDQVSRYSEFHVPISIASQIDSNFEDTSAKFWLTKTKDTFATKLRNHWFIINVQQSGYYRVQYDDESWKRIINLLLNSDEYQLIHVVNRAQIIDDLFHLAFIHEASYSYLFKAALYLRREKENLPWKAFERGINHLWENMNLRNQKDIEIFQRYVMYLTEPHVDRLGFDDAKDNSNPWPTQIRKDQLNRELILSLHCKFEKKPCVEQANKLADLNIRPGDISRNAKPAVLCTIIKHGDSRHWSQIWKLYSETRLKSEQLIYLDALGCTENESELRTYLSYIFENTKFPIISKENIPRALASIYKSSNTGWHLCYKYMIDHHMTVYKIFEDWDQVANIFIEIVFRIPNSEIADEFNFFLKNNHKNLEPITYELSNALYKARLTIRSFTYLTSNIIYNMKNTLKDIGVKDVEPNISTTQSAHTLLIVFMSIVPFLLLR